VRHVAQLARLAVDEARLPALAAELSRILEHMDVLQQVDVEGIDPDGRAGLAAPTRPDRVAPQPLAHPREQVAPAMRDGFFLVPRLATHQDGEEDAG
jgi:aspartyl-tRNA(Asn)/glutamyl-tRNA(Gln) amidotransferase subunit C